MLTNGGKLDGRYLLERKIGSGGFGAVYLATDTRFSGNNQVAIKQILLDNEQATKLFRQEADLLYNLSHSNLPKVTNCFQENGANFIVMDYISGEDLATSLKKGKQFSVAESLEIADVVLDALEYLHSFLIYHRDIKPHNIKINESGKIYLLDFGTAKGNFEESSVVEFGQSITGFTPFYAPLEQVLRVDPNSFLMLQSLGLPQLEEFLNFKTDERSDIYSLGATLYQILTGQAPERATATIRAYSKWSDKSDPLPSCREINSEISIELKNIINRCLEIEPEKRFQTAGEMRQALKNSLAVTFSPPISELLTIALPPGSNPAINISNPSIQPTAVFLNQSFSPSDEPKKEPVAAPHIIADQQILQPTVEANSAVLPSPNTKSAAAIPTNRNFYVAPEVIRSRLKSKLPIYLGLAFVFLVSIGFGGWFALRNSAEMPAIKPEMTKTETSAPPIVRNLRSLSYFLTVQKMRDGKPFQEPFQSSGQEIFENGYRFQMHFALPDDGYFYAFAEGLDEKGDSVLKMQFPTPKSNNGNAKVSSKKQYETGLSEFDGTPGTEKFWILWSREKPEIAENARADAFENKGVVNDPNLRNKLKVLLENAAKIQTNVTKETDKKITQIEFEGDAVAHLINLEHR